MQAMILAAGFGTRLQPYTNVRPKPLFPLFNKPLLCLTIERLQNRGFDHIIVNCHHLRSQIVDALGDYSGVVVQQEAEILGTGGGLRKALPAMKNEPLLVTNGDIYHTISFAEMYAAHVKQGNEVTMAMHDYERFNKVQVEDGRVTSFDKQIDGVQSLAFTGIHVINPDILQPIPEDTFSCIIDLYRRRLAEKKIINCYRTDSCYWTDMGTVADYLKLHEDLLSGTFSAWGEIGTIEGKQYVGSGVDIDPDAEIDDWCVCGDGVKIGSGAVIEKAVIWDNAEIKPDTRVCNTVITGEDNG